MNLDLENKGGKNNLKTEVGFTGRRLLNEIALNGKKLIFENQIGRRDPLIGLDVFLSPQHAARYLDVSVKLIYELMQRGELDAQPIGRRIKRIRRGTLDTWLVAQTQKFGR